MTKRQSARAKPARAAKPFMPPYAPSWVDRLTAFVDRLPGPAWFFYLVTALGLSLALSAIQWSEGAYAVGTFNASHIYTAFVTVYCLGLIHFLDRAADSAMASFAPLLTTATRSAQPDYQDHSDFQLLRYKLTTLPPRPTLLATVAGGAFASIAYAIDVARGNPQPYLTGTAGTPLSTASFMTVFIAGNAVVFLLAYHTIHQLTLVSRIYSRHARINIYQLQPLYSLSRPSALTAIGLILFVYGLFLISPQELTTDPIQLGLTLAFAGIAVVTFALPLYGAHRRLVAAKEACRAEVATRFEEATLQLHRELDRGRLTQMDQLNRALASLEIEENALRRIPTWPWQPGSVRAVAAALLLPVAVWVIQAALGRLLSI